MAETFLKYLKETTLTIIPISAIVFIIGLILNIETEIIASFFISSIMLIIGITLFTFGSDISMMLIGEKIGNKLMKSKNIPLIMITTLLIGIIITIVEPDLKILATQLTSIPDLTLILTVGLGVGIFLMLSAIKILFKWNLRTLIIISYSLIFISLFFLPQDFIPIAFDSSGVTTGPISVPFILTLGIGFAASRTDKETKNDTFGLIGLCSIGPIVTVLILGMLFQGTNSYDTSIYESNLPLIIEYVDNYFHSIKEVLISISPIILVFITFKLLTKNTFTKRETKKIILGFIITFLGLTIFLTGVNTGFMKTGFLIGKNLITQDYKNLIIPLAMIVGFLIVLVEPAVKILNNQIEEITEGSISKNIMQISLSIGVSLAIALALLRVFYHIPIIYILLPGYIIAIILSFITPKIFTAIAFDSGGSISGPLTATFILPFIIGVCQETGGNIFTEAFGLVAFVAMSPLITIQLLGVIFKIKTKQEIYKNIDETIIEYDWRNAL